MGTYSLVPLLRKDLEQYYLPSELTSISTADLQNAVTSANSYAAAVDSFGTPEAVMQATAQKAEIRVGTPRSAGAGTYLTLGSLFQLGDVISPDCSYTANSTPVCPGYPGAFKQDTAYPGARPQDTWICFRSTYFCLG